VRAGEMITTRVYKEVSKYVAKRRMIPRTENKDNELPLYQPLDRSYNSNISNYRMFDLQIRSKQSAELLILYF